MGSETFVIVGAGPCGVAAAASLRSEGFSGKIMLFGREEGLPYERPPLSKRYLTGLASDDDLHLRSASWYSDNDVSYFPGSTVVSLDPRYKRILLKDGASFGFDRALIATGGAPRVFPGAKTGGRILVLRSREDARRLVPYLKSGAKITIVGGGFIGSEVAATANSLGADVTIVEPVGSLMLAPVGPLVGSILTAYHRARGVTVLLEEKVARLREAKSGVVTTTDRGRKIASDVVLICIGLEPNVGILHSSGLSTKHGIEVDARCRIGGSDVFAAGDVAGADHPLFGERMRIEHHSYAIAQGAFAARSMLGIEGAFREVPWGWSDQYDLNIQVAGRPSLAEVHAIRGSPAEMKFSVAFARCGRVVGVVGVNAGRDVAAAKSRIAAASAIDLSAFSDQDKSLSEAWVQT